MGERIKPQQKAFERGAADATAGRPAGSPYAAKAFSFNKAYDRGYASVKK